MLKRLRRNGARGSLRNGIKGAEVVERRAPALRLQGRCGAARRVRWGHVAGQVDFAPELVVLVVAVERRSLVFQDPGDPFG